MADGLCDIFPRNVFSSSLHQLLDTFFDSVFRTSFLYAELLALQSPERQISVKKMLTNPINILEEDKETQKPRDPVFIVDKTGLSVVQSTELEAIAHNAKRQIAPLA